MGASHISLTQRERQYLKVLADGDKARRTADRARILLLRADGMTIQDIAEKMELSTRTIQTRISRYRHKGLEAALFDNLHPGRPAEISPDAKEWLLDTARHTPADLGCQGDEGPSRLYSGPCRRGRISKTFHRYKGVSPQAFIGCGNNMGVKLLFLSAN